MKAATTAILACLLSSLLPFQPVSAQVVVSRTVYLMGTRTTLAVRTADRNEARRQLERMVRSLEQTDAELSTWRADSELGVLNQQPVGQSFGISAPLCRMWPELTAWHDETGKTFDPTIGALIDAWGLRRGGRVPSPAQLSAARVLTGFDHFDFDAVECRVTRKVHASLDAGAFGKGAGLRRLQRDYGGASAPWLVDLGGQVAVSERPVANAWPVAIAHPDRRDEVAIEIRLAGGSLATSGGSERSWVIAGQGVSHILDPRTGRPVNRRGSVSVWHQDPLVADVLSTALYVMGPEEGLRYAEANGLAVLFLADAPESDRAAVVTRASHLFRQLFLTADSSGVPSGS